MRAFAFLPVAVSLTLVSASSHLAVSPEGSADPSAEDARAASERAPFFAPEPPTTAPQELPHHPALREYYFSRVA